MLNAFLTLLVFAQPINHIQDQEKKCIPAHAYDQIVTIVKSYDCLQQHKPIISIDPWVVLLDQDGRIYSGPGHDANTDIDGTIQWCSFTVDFKLKPKLKKHTRIEKNGGTRFRAKAYVFAKIAYLKEPKDILDAGIGIDFLYYKGFNFQGLTGIFSFGLAIGYDITKNFGIVTGIVNPYWEFRLSPIVGLYFGF